MRILQIVTKIVLSQFGGKFSLHSKYYKCYKNLLHNRAFSNFTFFSEDDNLKPVYGNDIGISREKLIIQKTVHAFGFVIVNSFKPLTILYLM